MLYSELYPQPFQVGCFILFLFNLLSPISGALMHKSVGNPLERGQPASSHHPKEEWLLPSKGSENVTDEWVEGVQGSEDGEECRESPSSGYEVAFAHMNSATLGACIRAVQDQAF